MTYFDIILFRYILILLPLYTMYLHTYIHTHTHTHIYMEDIFQKFPDEKNKRKKLETVVTYP